MKKLLLLILSIGLSQLSYADYLDDWPDNALCEWMENPSTPSYMVEEVKTRGIICSGGNVIKESAREEMSAAEAEALRIDEMNTPTAASNAAKAEAVSIAEAASAASAAAAFGAETAAETADKASAVAEAEAASAADEASACSRLPEGETADYC